MNVTDCFIDNVISFSQREWDTTVLEKVQDCIFDFVGCAYGGHELLKDKLAQYFDSSLYQGGKSPTIGSERLSSMCDATLINAMEAHVTELDDGCRLGMIHPGSPVISALLSVSSYEEVSDEDLIKATVVGYETAIRLGLSVQPNHKRKGYHATGTCGTIGVAMAVAVALHLSRKQMKSALAAAITSAAGTIEMNEDSSELKPYNAGRAACEGIRAAYLGKVGFCSPDDPIGGRYGFLNLFSDSPSEVWLTEPFDGIPKIMFAYVKPYAACRHCHPAIDASIKLSTEKAVDVDKILSVKVKTYDLAVKGHDHTVVNSPIQARMSIPFSVAVALIQKEFLLEATEENNIRNPQIVDLAKKVSVSEDPGLTSLLPKKRCAVVEIRTIDDLFSCRIDYSKGEPENPMSREDLVEKFMCLVRFSGQEMRMPLSIVSAYRDGSLGINSLNRLLFPADSPSINSL